MVWVEDVPREVDQKFDHHAAEASTEYTVITEISRSTGWGSETAKLCHSSIRLARDFCNHLCRANQLVHAISNSLCDITTWTTMQLRAQQ